MNETELQNKLRNHKKNPPSTVWDGIQGRLKQKRGFRLWWFSLGIPVILILLTGGYMLVQPYGSFDDTKVTQTSSPESDKRRIPNEKSEADRNRQNGSKQAKSTENDALELSNSTKKNRTGDMTKNQSGEEASMAPTVSKADQSKDSEQDESSVASLGHPAKDEQAMKDRQKKDIEGGLSKFQTRKLNFKEAPGPLKASTIPFSTENDLPDSLSDSQIDDKQNQTQNKWQFGVQLAPLISQYQYNLRSDNQMAYQGQEATLKAESAGKGFMINATLSYRFSEKLRLTSGFGYSYNKQDFRHQYRYKALDEDEMGDSDNSPSDDEEDEENEDSRDNTPDDSYEDTDMRGNPPFNQKDDNTYHRFNIPLMINYDLINQTKWQWFANVGLRFQYLFSVNDNLIRGTNVNALAIEVENMDNSLINNFNIGYSVQTGLRYQLNNDWAINVAPALEGQFFSLYDEDYFLERRSFSYGGTIGISKTF